MGRDLLGGRQAVFEIDEEELKKAEKEKKKLNASGFQSASGQDLRTVAANALNALKARRAESGFEAHRRGRAYIPAFKNAYFNRDISAPRAVNQRTGNMRALRGAAEVTDLRRVVLPEASMPPPDPAALQAASARMAAESLDDLEMTDLLQRQGDWAQSKGMTIEKLEARMQQLEGMIAARKTALARIQKQAPKSTSHLAPSVSTALEGDRENQSAPDIERVGTAMVHATAQHAAGMHRHMAKMLGIKIKPEG